MEAEAAVVKAVVEAVVDASLPATTTPKPTPASVAITTTITVTTTTTTTIFVIQQLRAEQPLFLTSQTSRNEPLVIYFFFELLRYGVTD